MYGKKMTKLIRRTSKQDIMMPHAGAILAIRGVSPAYRALTPSVLTMFLQSPMSEVVVDDPPAIADITIACRRVLSVSNGETTTAAVVPLRAPLMKAT